MEGSSATMIESSYLTSTSCSKPRAMRVIMGIGDKNLLSAAGAEPASLQPGEFVAAADVAQANRELVAGKFAATAGEDRRTTGETCALLLATAGGRTSDAAAVRGDARLDRAATDTDGIDWTVVHSAAESVYKLVGIGRGVAKVGHKWAISGCAGGGWHTVGSASDGKSFHGVANGRDGVYYGAVFGVNKGNFG